MAAPPPSPILKTSDEFKFFDHSLKELSRSGHLKPDVHRKFISEVETKKGVDLDWGKIFSQSGLTYSDAIGRTMKLQLEASKEGKLQGIVHPPTGTLKGFFFSLIMEAVIRALELILPEVTCPMIVKFRSIVEPVLNTFNVSFKDLCDYLKCDCE